MGDQRDEKSTTQALREEFSPDRVEQKLQEVVEERPKARHLLDFSIVGKALLAAVVVAVLLWLIFSPQLAGIALVVVFLGAWLGMAQLSYDRRRETRDASADDADDDEDAKPDPSGYEGDRGEVEAEREQEGDREDEQSSNGSASDRRTADSKS
jgi:hypothetical protein